MRRRQHLGWHFRPERAAPRRGVSGPSEGAGRRAGANPWPRQQSLEGASAHAEESHFLLLCRFLFTHDV